MKLKENKQLIPRFHPKTHKGGSVGAVSKRIILAVVLVSVAFIIALGWMFWQISTSSDTGNTPNATQEETNQQVSQASRSKLIATQQSADQAVYSTGGNIDRGLAVYDSAIDTAPPNELPGLYSNKALLAINNDKTDAAYDAAMAAIAADPAKSSDTPYFVLAIVYEKRKEFAKSETSYQQALDVYMENTTQTNNATVDFYKDKIKEMKNLAL